MCRQPRFVLLSYSSPLFNDVMFIKLKGDLERFILVSRFLIIMKNLQSATIFQTFHVGVVKI
ncbi:hypothetical protein QFZ80_002988 [Paenibacillus sp. V4I7]|nr:hypothetical protein [Paenibacillus sp. V4I7]